MKGPRAQDAKLYSQLLLHNSPIDTIGGDCIDFVLTDVSLRFLVAVCSRRKFQYHMFVLAIILARITVVDSYQNNAFTIFWRIKRALRGGSHYTRFDIAHPNSTILIF